MKESGSFSGNETERLSLNFKELYQEGIRTIQQLSGSDWTDYNVHDPGVTILEQLCYALTDLALRSSLPVQDILSPGKGVPVDAANHAFFTPSAILSSQPVTLTDMRKLIIDAFSEIQNVWIIPKENTGFQEEVGGLYDLEMLPRLSFLNAIKTNPSAETKFLNDLGRFLNANRNLAEDFQNIRLLQPQLFQVEFDVHIHESADVEATIARLFLTLFEYIYKPVNHYSYAEMQAAGYELNQIFSGPRLSNGFIQAEKLKERPKRIQSDEFQKLFSKVMGISKCEVKHLRSGGKIHLSDLQAEAGKFFHLLADEEPGKPVQNRYESIYSGMNVFVNNKKLLKYNKHAIDNLFFEMWSKTHRGYSLGNSQDEYFHEKLKGTFRNVVDYQSVQQHFPMVYGIGEEGLSKHETNERHAQALQLKAYLMLFEQHMANHLAQLSELNEFFSVSTNSTSPKTYFSQYLSSVPDVAKLASAAQSGSYAIAESPEDFFRRKNRVFDHLLARFGEELNALPWRVAFSLSLIPTRADLNRILLEQKSAFLKQLENLSYHRATGELLEPGEKNQLKRIPSGLERMLLAKTGIPSRGNNSLVPEFADKHPGLQQTQSERFIGATELENNFRPIRIPEQMLQEKHHIPTGIADVVFGKIGLKVLFKETLDLKNYRLSESDSDSGKVKLIFRKTANTWVHLTDCQDESEAAQLILKLTRYFIRQNKKSEGLILVDHILLRDFLDGSKFGFSFIDEFGDPLFQTMEDESWCSTEAGRNANLASFFTRGLNSESYQLRNGRWVLSDAAGSVLASYESRNQYLQLSEDHPEEIAKQTRNIIRLLNGADPTGGRLRFDEMERIRQLGTLEFRHKQYRQRRLVFQRKLPSGEIIDEDFFNLNVSFVLPDWPARFQDEQFRDYLKELIQERIPSHIGKQIWWLNIHQFAEFERFYTNWERLKSEHKKPDLPSEQLRNAAYGLYKVIQKLKK